MPLFKRLISPLLALTLSSTCAAESIYDSQTPTELEGRMIVRQLQELIIENSAWTPEELALRVPAFQALYKTQMLPRFKELAIHISPGAMQWVDIDWDNEPEFIFWTEGLAPDTTSIKEYLYVVKIDVNGEGYVMRSHPLQPRPTKSGNYYKYSRFWDRPNKNLDTNPEVRALLTYGSFGEINVAYTNLEIRWDPRQDKVLIHEFRTHFPIAVEGYQARDH